MRDTIASAIFWTVLFAAGLCASAAVLVLSIAVPGAAFPPANATGVLITIAVTVAGTAFASLKLLTGDWLPAQDDQTLQSDADYAHYRSEDLEQARHEQRDEDDRYNEDERYSEYERYDEEERENDRLTGRNADRLMPF